MPNHRSDRVCSFNGCNRKHCARGYCKMHWQKLSRHGDPAGGGPARGFTAKFIEQVALDWSSRDCLLWPHALNQHGYGLATFEGHASLAHRIVCELVHGPCPSSRHEAAHSCGVRACVNPQHLRWATPAENNNDRKAHGTNTDGERHYACRITDDEVAQIRELAGSITHAAIAKRFGLSRSHVTAIINHRLRKHPTGQYPVAAQLKESV